MWFLVPVTGGSVFAVAGCLPLKLPEESLPEHTRLLCGTQTFVEISGEESRPESTNKMSTKSAGWGSATYQENNPGNIIVIGVWLMLPTISSVFHSRMMFLHFPLTRKHCQILIITSIPNFPVSHLFLMPFLNHPSAKQPIFSVLFQPFTMLQA